MKIYNLTKGDSPLIISIPHSGIFVPESIKRHFTAIALSVPDTDWHVDKLYEDFASANNTTMLKANYSRYVVDLNRSLEDEDLYPGQTKTGLCPLQSFNRQNLYNDIPDMAGRVQKYWLPYHNELKRQIERVKDIHGYAIVYDAHSISSVVPSLFEGTLPDLNLGTVNNTSCAENMARAAFDAAKKSSYESVLNGRFIGGYITRNYGDPDNNIHALQMELTQKNYMDEDSFEYDEIKAAQLKPVLERILQSILKIK